MATQQYDYGMIGLGTMGRNLVYNMCDHGFSVAGFDKDNTKVDALVREGEGKPVYGAHDLKNFFAVLKSPKVVMLLVPAGAPVDAVVAELKPFLSVADLVIDCGNSHYTDTDRRIAQLAEQQIRFMGVGISGGEYGARHGPSIMPGGMHEAYMQVAPVLEAIAAQVNGAPCVTYLGKGSAGHYVKMVHNGIEYGMMQAIAEIYNLLKTGVGMNNERLHEVFSKWNEGRLQSYLVGITADIFAQKDTETGNDLVDMILDTSEQNGTGQWTSQSAMDMHLPIPTIDAAVSARDLSALKDERQIAQKIFDWRGRGATFKGSEGELVNWLEDALYFTMITTYAQGMYLMQRASVVNNYGLKPEDVARIWRGGCIIRSALLEDIMQAYQNDVDLVNLMLDKEIALKLEQSQDGFRLALKEGISIGVAMPVMSAALAYYDGYRNGSSPANLIQAQRDYFGAHTYKRTDKTGSFHTQWNQKTN
ncbi:NADP-dependent phosphogluconate dehydrogenase [Taibaiella soli]|uniref:6-phosphogluconate dehydrogenase, decarboxylating n=1 Tax=Taibaiella soli TaxID=1649169 RepID=A0A2W2B9V6_9BACT|nr:NADP-dependent phosphogluconate dehydrogenase [Taibaiella soli]PZF72687.1 phosphogluconate dehydrogenase (NADP(+)-dependent, decarboxylating) [Taibaiella soli]